MENHDVIIGNHHELLLDHEMPIIPNPNTNHHHGNGDATEFDNSNQHQNRFDDGNVDDDNDDVDHGIGQQLVNHHEMIISNDHHLVEHQNSDVGVEPVSFQNPVIQIRTTPPPSYELMVGQEFPDVASCRRALRHTAIALHFEIQTVKSDKTRFTAKCASEGCPWRIHAAKLPGLPTFSIRTIHEEHNCGGIAHLGHQQASVDWVANTVEQRLKENPQCKPKDILEEIHRAHGITLSYKQAWRGKERIMAALRGSFEEDYRLLPQYCEQIRRTNPNSIASVYVDPADNCFQRLFISFQASIHGFLNACRPLLGLDRAVLKNKYLGTLLLATGFDGDGALFPLAFGVVDQENEENWMWFLSELRSLLEINTENMPRLTILSDRNKNIVDAVEVNFPIAFHGFCMHHLSESFRKEFNNTMLVNHLWDAANALTIMEFESKILEIEEISQEAAYWIRRVPPRLWATAYFEGTRFGHLTANIVESLNVWILEASGLPIIQMMESIRRQLMTWFSERREASMQWTSILVPTAERRVLEAIERAQTYQVLKANEAEFEVISHEGTNIVDIRNRRCQCSGWQLNGLPCAHAVAALLSCRQNVHRFTESCFTVATYRRAYSQAIHPVPDKTLWSEMTDLGLQDEGSSSVNEIVINPPKCTRHPGRPRKRRVRSEDRRSCVKRIVRCSRCNQTGHFRTTCSAPI
ncbi:uncharacterized protein [Rutidosis leptorrhynchoides]|uniref:uncharacterized protein n=1 Tax=Rutidosis leptorrhynchoides TaxID=125765 RepID=UPI003A9983BC